MTLTPRAALLALLGVPLALIGRPLLLAGAVLLMLAIVVDVARAGAVRALTLTRSGPSTARMGTSVELALALQNGGARRLRGELRDAWPPSAGSRPRSVSLDVGPGRRQRVMTTLTPTRRGDRRPDLVTIRSVGPLGLAGRQRSQAVPWTLRVLPGFASRRHLPSRLARLRELDGARASRTRGQGTEFDSLREYVVGDDSRSVDWRATARRGDVVVRTWRPERDRHVLVVVDCGRTSAARLGDAPRLDWAMDAALLLTALATRAGDRVDVLAFDRAVRASVAGASAEVVLSSVVNALAPVQPALVEPDHRRLVAEVLRRARRRSLVVVLTSLEPAAFEAGWTSALSVLADRHLVLLASVRDPRLDELAAGRADAAAVYAAAAAATFRTGRDQVAAVLRRRGVEVVDADPEHVAPALADAYLALKSAGRL